MILQLLRKYFSSMMLQAKLADDRGITLIVVLMVMAILLSVIGAGLLFSGVNTKIAMNYRTGTQAFNAADIGITAVASTVNINGAPSVGPTAVGNNLCYRSGYRDGTQPPAPLEIEKLPPPGFALGRWVSYQYPIAVTGTYRVASGCPPAGEELPGTAARVVEAQAMYGPVSK